MAKSSKRWLHAQSKDQFVKQSRLSHYRSRAVYKLSEIDKQDQLFQSGNTVVDLGSAPGSWSQYASEKAGTKGKVIAVDILSMQEIANVTFIKGDFTESTVFKKCLDSLNDTKADLVISDMAPNLSGIRTADQARSMHLSELVFDFSCRVLNHGGNMLVKVFQGAGTDTFRSELMQRFQKVTVRKPKASRDSSREYYVLARGYDV